MPFSLKDESHEEHPPDESACFGCFRGMTTAFFEASGMHPYTALGFIERLKLEILDSLMESEAGDDKETQEP